MESRPGTLYFTLNLMGSDDIETKRLFIISVTVIARWYRRTARITIHLRICSRISDFYRRQRTDHLIMYIRAKVLKKIHPGVSSSPSENDVSSHFWRGAFDVQWANNERLTRRVRFGTMVSGENPGSDRIS